MNRVAVAVGAVAGLGMAGLAIAHAGPGITAIGPLRRRLFPRLAGLGRPDHVALTFDDGPDPASTPAFLELLAARRLHATFFLLGSMVDRAPELAAQIAAAGHEVAVHGWGHRYSILRSARDMHSDLARATAVVAAATGQRPAFFRPPYGVLSAGALDAARGLGLTPVLWSSWGREWTAGATAGSVADTVLASLGGGATITGRVRGGRPGRPAPRAGRVRGAGAECRHPRRALARPGDGGREQRTAGRIVSRWPPERGSRGQQCWWVAPSAAGLPAVPGWPLWPKSPVRTQLPFRKVRLTEVNLTESFGPGGQPRGAALAGSTQSAGCRQRAT